MTGVIHNQQKKCLTCTYIYTHSGHHTQTHTHKQSNKQEGLRQIKNTLNADGKEQQLLLLN